MTYLQYSIVQFVFVWRKNSNLNQLNIFNIKKKLNNYNSIYFIGHNQANFMHQEADDTLEEVINF